MSFGYSMLRGRKGASGFTRESDGSRQVSLRGLAPGESCALYALSDGGARLCGEKRADSSGQLQLDTREQGPLFAIAENEIRLWENGEDTRIRAAAWLERRGKKERSAPPRPRETPQAETPPPKTGGSGENQASPVPDEAVYTLARERETAAETPTEAREAPPPYTLRAPGSGEPVDALPERKVRGHSPQRAR